MRERLGGAPWRALSLGAPVRAILAMTFVALAAVAGAAEAATPIPVVVAEAVWAEPVAVIGGDGVRVTTILSNPATDPHDYEPAASASRAVADAALVVATGASYDPWMDRLRQASRSPQRREILVADLLQRKAGDNPHLWFDPAAMPAVAEAVAASLSAADPANAAVYAGRAADYRRQLQAIADRVAAFRARFAGTPATASEPVFGLMADALGLAVHNASFQRAVMNGTEPSARDIAAMEADLRDARVRVFFYNSQVTDSLTDHLLSLAHGAGVAVVAVGETKPADVTYVQWLVGLIDATERAVAGPTP
jgi:zinc/manganese transport system substrate-binding protein